VYQEKVKIQTEPLRNYEYQGVCHRCGRWLEGAEVFDRERGWIVSWTHIDYDKRRTKYCLAA